MVITFQAVRHDATKAAFCFLYAGTGFGVLGAGAQHVITGATSFCMMTLVHALVFVVSHIMHL